MIGKEIQQMSNTMLLKVKWPSLVITYICPHPK